MIYNNVDMDSAPAIEEYKEPPTWMETLGAAMDNFTAVSLSTSEFNYYNDERTKNMADWKEKDPANKGLYDRVGTMPKQVVEKLEALYEDGNYKAIENWNSMDTGKNFLKFKELEKQHGFSGPAQTIEIAKNNSLRDYYESGQVMAESEYTSAKLLGTMAGALQDPITLATLPIGSWKTGGTIMANAARAFGEEALIELGAQTAIAPKAYAYKTELGIKTSIKEEAYNAVASIGAAGLLRGTGSAVFDLSEKGIRALKLKNPDLGEAYESLSKGNASADLESHIDDLHKAEFSDEPITEITNPSAKGAEINKAEAVPEIEAVEEKLIVMPDEAILDEADKAFGFSAPPKKKISRRAQEIKEAAEPKIGGSEQEARESVKRLMKGDLDVDKQFKKMSGAEIDELERLFRESEAMEIVTGKDIDGKMETKSYKDLNKEYDDNDIMLKAIEDCLMGVK